ncbi:N-acetylmuramoyl-L-alanine amidase family protein [Almyronema epifaneia]|uniref:N-acetylmuramoyl-L-alanine amidase n=1 Tax=Almyronema epifaneia S1 TaxID=2991925 RepID=A0ABW6I925_9CYAN
MRRLTLLTALTTAVFSSFASAAFAQQTLPPVPTLPGQTTPLASSAAASQYQVLVPINAATLLQQVRQIEPGAFQTTVAGRSAIQVGLFQEQRWAIALQQRLASASLMAEVQQLPAANGTAYQVIVPVRADVVQAQVRTIEPSAFQTVVNGQAMIQAGVFREQRWAIALQQKLGAANLTSQIVTLGTPIVAVPVVDRPQTPQSQVVIVLDPGHGGNDPGAIGISGLQEKSVNLAIAQRVQQVLQQQGIQAILTRSDDREVDLAPRVTQAERLDADVFVSIHANAISLSRPDINGLETYYYQSGRELAESIHSSVLNQSDIRDRGVRQARFYVLRNTSMPAVLVETGFVTGREDAERFRDVAARNQIAEAIAQGILNYVERSRLGERV